MAIYWSTPGFKGRTFKLCVLTRWDFNFCVRSSPLRGFKEKACKLLGSLQSPWILSLSLIVSMCVVKLLNISLSLSLSLSHTHTHTLCSHSRQQPQVSSRCLAWVLHVTAAEVYCLSIAITIPNIAQRNSSCLKLHKINNSTEAVRKTPVCG